MFERKTNRNTNDLTDEEWTRVVPLIPKGSKGSSKPSVAPLT